MVRTFILSMIVAFALEGIFLLGALMPYPYGFSVPWHTHFLALSTLCCYFIPSRELMTYFWLIPLGNIVLMGCVVFLLLQVFKRSHGGADCPGFYRRNARFMGVVLLLLLGLGVATYRTAFIGYAYAEDESPSGEHKWVLFHVPSLAEFQPGVAGDSGMFYVWIRLYTIEGKQLYEKRININELNDEHRIWSDDAAIIDGETVWEL